MLWVSPQSDDAVEFSSLKAVLVGRKEGATGVLERPTCGRPIRHHETYNGPWR